MRSQKTVCVIGAGPSGLSAAEWLAAQGVEVRVYDRMGRPGAKFLLAGRSGLNLTHSEPFDRLMTRYGCAQSHLAESVSAFPPAAVQSWSEGLGQPCFVGSSGRLFPVSMKASPLLRAWLRRLRTLGVQFFMRHEWQGWDESHRLLFSAPTGAVNVEAAAVVLALGGATWPRFGSDGAWTAHFEPECVALFRPANCGFLTGLPPAFHERYQGHVLHSVKVSLLKTSARGDIMITRDGFEGAPIYHLASHIREMIRQNGQSEIQIDLRPGVPETDLVRKTQHIRSRESASNVLRRLGLAPASRALILAFYPQSTARAQLVERIKRCSVNLVAPQSLTRAISSAGGFKWHEVDSHLMLRRRPGVFLAGEMLDWEAPTGGYLLQACFATGRKAGQGVLNWLRSDAA